MLEQEPSQAEKALSGDGPVPGAAQSIASSADVLLGAEADSAQPQPIVSRELSAEERARLEVVQQLLIEEEGTTMRQRQQLAAVRLGIGVRSVQRLVARWCEIRK